MLCQFQCVCWALGMGVGFRWLVMYNLNDMLRSLSLDWEETLSYIPHMISALTRPVWGVLVDKTGMDVVNLSISMFSWSIASFAVSIVNMEHVLLVLQLIVQV